MTLKQIENELITLSTAERLRLAHWLLDTLVEPPAAEQPIEDNPLLNIAGRFSGGPGDTAERAEAILAREVDPTYGLGKR